MKRVMLIAYDFPPRGGSGVFRIAKFARYLPAWGWQPAVVTVADLGPHPDHRLLAELPREVEIVRTATGQRARRLSATSEAGARRRNGDRRGWRARARPWIVPDPQLGWVPGAVRAAERRLRHGDIDVIMTSGPPFSTHLIGWLLKRRRPALRWVMDMRDLWSEGFNQHLLIPSMLNRWLERACVRQADAVTVVTESMGRVMVDALGADPRKVVTITNGFDREDIPPVSGDGCGVRDGSRPCVVCYVGTITEGQIAGIASLFAALHHLYGEGMSPSDLVIRLVGTFGASIQARAQPLVDAGLVEIVPFLPHHQAIACMMDADVLLLVRPDDLDGRIVHTSKIFEYMAVGRPILAVAPPGEITRLIDDEALGVWVTPHDVAGIAAAMRALVQDHRAGTLRATLPDQARLRRWERRELAGELARLLERLVAAQRNE